MRRGGRGVRIEGDESWYESDAGTDTDTHTYTGGVVRRIRRATELSAGSVEVDL